MIVCRKRHGRWYWVCTRCRPWTTGSTATFARLLVSLRQHERARRCHHEVMTGRRKRQL